MKLASLLTTLSWPWLRFKELLVVLLPQQPLLHELLMVKELMLQLYALLPFLFETLCIFLFVLLPLLFLLLCLLALFAHVFHICPRLPGSLSIKSQARRRPNFAAATA
jgi:hypothetical protein